MASPSPSNRDAASSGAVDWSTVTVGQTPGAGRSRTGPSLAWVALIVGIPTVFLAIAAASLVAWLAMSWMGATPLPVAELPEPEPVEVVPDDRPPPAPAKPAKPAMPSDPQVTDVEVADRLFRDGRPAEAVEKYKSAFAQVEPFRRAEVLKRIVEHEAQEGNEDEARSWIERGLDQVPSVDYRSAAAKRLTVLVEADRLYEKGQTGEAVATYKSHFESAKPKDRPEMLRRIVEHEADKGDAVAARRWLERGLDDGMVPRVVSAAAVRLLTHVEADRLHAAGKHAEAVAKYKDLFAAAKPADSVEMLRRIVEHEAGKGDGLEARRWIERGLDQGLMPRYTSAAAVQIVAHVEADRLHEAGKKAEATQKYKKLFETLLPASQALVLRRIVEHEVAAGNESEARRWIEQGLERKLLAGYAAPAAVKLAADVEGEWRRQRREDRIKQVLADLKSTDPSLRRAALLAVAELGDRTKEAVPDLSASVLDSQALVRLAALDSLRALGPEAKAAVPHLARALTSSDRETRKGAIRVLASIGPEARAAASALVAMLGDTSCRQDASQALVKIGKGAVPALVEDGLKSTKVLVRQWSARTLGTMGADARDALPRLTELSQSDTWTDVRDAAVLAIGQIKR